MLLRFQRLLQDYLGEQRRILALQREGNLAELDRALRGVINQHANGLNDTARAISAINDRNLVIASASEEQVQVAREVDRNLVAIRDLSMQSAAGANQTNAASQELSRLAVGLNGLVTRFRV